MSSVAAASELIFTIILYEIPPAQNNYSVFTTAAKGHIDRSKQTIDMISCNKRSANWWMVGAKIAWNSYVEIGSKNKPKRVSTFPGQL
jgi:hypothetical protein